MDPPDRRTCGPELNHCRLKLSRWPWAWVLRADLPISGPRQTLFSGRSRAGRSRQRDTGHSGAAHFRASTQHRKGRDPRRRRSGRGIVGPEDASPIFQRGVGILAGPRRFSQAEAPRARRPPRERIKTQEERKRPIDTEAPASRPPLPVGGRILLSTGLVEPAIGPSHPRSSTTRPRSPRPSRLPVRS